MWSLSIGWRAPLPTVFAAGSSNPPKAFYQLRRRVQELQRLADGGVEDHRFTQQLTETMTLLQGLHRANQLPIGSGRPESIRPLLENRLTLRDGLSRLNQIVESLGIEGSSLPISMPDSFGEEREPLQDRPSWVGNFHAAMGRAQETLRQEMAPKSEDMREERQRLTRIAMRLWNQQWPATQKVTLRTDAPTVAAQLVPVDAVEVAPYVSALAVTGLAGETALAILDDAHQRHLLAHVSEAMDQEKLNEQIRGTFPSLALSRIYVMTGAGLGLGSAVRVLFAMLACGRKKLESGIVLLRSSGAVQFPSLLLHGGEIYIYPADQIKSQR